MIGGGIQGSCVALELARRGARVDLFEVSSSPMSAASRHNEGKVHLGFVYANDPGLATADLMISGAAAFWPLLRRWLGQATDDIPTSAGFEYLVHENSLLAADQLEAAYREIARRIRSRGVRDYAGCSTPDRLERLPGRAWADRYGDPVRAVFRTEEVAVDPDWVADRVVQALEAAPGIEVTTGHSVEAVDPETRSLVVVDRQGVTTTAGPYHHVVNCAWAGRLRLDDSMGLRPRESWTFRMKYFVRTGTPPGGEIPPATVVLGPFGDLVDFGNGHRYLSWYPAGRRGWSAALEPPDWPPRPAPTLASGIAEQIRGGLSTVIPAIDRRAMTGEDDVVGGVIYSLGSTDVDDPTSTFHRRSEVGPVTLGGWYHSIDTGKYTMGPLFAVQAADRMVAR